MRIQSKHVTELADIEERRGQAEEELREMHEDVQVRGQTKINI